MEPLSSLVIYNQKVEKFSTEERFYGDFMIGFNKDVEYLKDWNKDLALTDDEQEAIDVHNRCIRAYELLSLCFSLLARQQHSPYVLNLLEEILVDADGDECDGGYVFEEIENLLIESGELVEEDE